MASSQGTVNASLFHRLEAGGNSAVEINLGPAAGRVSAGSVHRTWEQLIEARRTDAAPVELAATSALSELHIFGFAILSAPSVDAALETAATYFPLINDSGSWHLERSASATRLAWEHPPATARGARASIESVMANFIAGIAEICGGQVRPRVSLAHPPPRDRRAFNALCGREVEFDSRDDENAIELERATLARRPPFADHRLHAFFRRECDAALKALDDRSEVVSSVRRVVRDLLETGEATAVVVAHQLALSERTLSRRLARADTSFSAELSHVRRHQARALLSQTRLPVGEIANRLGFAEAASLSRYCRKTFGGTPTTLRRRWAAPTS